MNMKFRYDKKVDEVYIELAKGKYDATRKIYDVVLVDEDKKRQSFGNRNFRRD